MGKRRVTDTTDFYAIDSGDEIEIGDRVYRVTGNEKERRFGMEDPKFWVKRAEDTASGERKIIKLSYFESFSTTLGGVEIRCFRNPKKEADIVDFMKDHPHFMKGVSHSDEKGNSIRVLDIVHGRNFFVHIQSLYMNHKDYFQQEFPEILDKLITAFESIGELHDNGFKHGDIRNDHIIIERHTGHYVWIDFDYDYQTTENPFSLDIFGLGNILLAAAGKGTHSLYDIRNMEEYGDLFDRLAPGDFSILEKWRFCNLQKLYGYVPDRLNRILMHFSRDASVYYESVGEMVADMKACRQAGWR